MTAKLFCALLLVICAVSVQAAESTRTVYAWFPRDMGASWGDTKAIDWSAITHLSFRSVVLQPDGTIATPVPSAKVKALVDEAHKHNVKVTVLAWGSEPASAKGVARGAHSSKYLAHCPEKTVQALLDYVKEHNLDGVNVDDESWE